MVLVVAVSQEEVEEEHWIGWRETSLMTLMGLSMPHLVTSSSDDSLFSSTESTALRGKNVMIIVEYANKNVGLHFI